MAVDLIARGMSANAIAKIKELLEVGGFTVSIVDALPTTDINAHKIYLLINEDGIYDEYIYVDDDWVKISSIDISLDGYVTETELETETTAIYQVTANLLTSINATNTDVTELSQRLETDFDEIDTQITNINTELDGIDEEIGDINDNVQAVSANIEMYRQKVVRDGATTFGAVDNTDYQWSTSQDSLVVTLPAVTDFTRTHIINLNFIAGSSSPLSLFGDYNTPVDWEFVEGCLYQIEFKYIETAWEIKQYCPEKEYASADDLDDKVDVPTLTANGLTEIIIASLGDNEVHGYLGDGSSGITSLTITEIDQTETGAESIILIETGDTFTFTPPTNMRSIGDLTFETNTEYIIVIRAGICVIGKLNEV